MLFFYIILALSGALAGLLAGLFGIGGGIILVPALYYTHAALFPDAIPAGFSEMHLAIGTSLAVILPTGFSSAVAHWKHNAIRFDILSDFAPGVVLGAAIGVISAGFITGPDLKILFSAVIIALAGMFIFSDKLTSLKNKPFSKPQKAAGGFIIGGISVLAGIGGATLSVPLMRIMGIALPQAIATASVIGLLIALPGAIGFCVLGILEHGYTGAGITGYINWLAWVLIVPLSVLTAPVGAKAAHKMNVRKLRPLFAGFMVLVALKMLIDGLSS